MPAARSGDLKSRVLQSYHYLLSSWQASWFYASCWNDQGSSRGEHSGCYSCMNAARPRSAMSPPNDTWKWVHGWASELSWPLHSVGTREWRGTSLPSRSGRSRFASLRATSDKYHSFSINATAGLNYGRAAWWLRGHPITWQGSPTDFGILPELITDGLSLSAFYVLIWGSPTRLKWVGRFAWTFRLFPSFHLLRRLFRAAPHCRSFLRTGYWFRFRPHQTSLESPTTSDSAPSDWIKWRHL